MTTVLNQLSDALRAQAAAAQSIVVAIRNAEGRHLTGTLWQDDVVITSEQAMADRESYSIVSNGQTVTARIVGRDPGTNVLALRTEQPLKASPRTAAEADIGALVLAFGATSSGTPTARLGLVSALGPQWHSRSGGRIDARVALDIGAHATELTGSIRASRARDALLG